MSSASIRIEVIDVPVPEGTNIIIGQAHFIKTVEDIYEALSTSVPGIRFGVAFNESSGKRLVRHEGNDNELRKLAAETAYKIGVGHLFVIYMRNAWPINVLNSLRNIQEITYIHVATANPIQVIIADTGQGRALLGVVDGMKPLGIEDEKEIEERRKFLRQIGYKL
ncbi:MAG: adenosine-specific kinase [Pyrodictiaceae archaeon]